MAIVSVPRLVLACAALCLLIGAPTATAIELSDLLTGYTVSSWTQREGVKFGSVRATVQDGEGFLWVGTNNGLVRFDGSHFSTWEALGGAPLPQRAIRSLLATTDGALWIGFAEGGVCRVPRGAQACEAREPGAPTGGVSSLLEDESHTVWAAAAEGVFYWHSGEWGEAGASFFGSASALAMSSGHVLVGTDKGLFEIERSGTAWRRLDAHATPRAVVVDRTGRVFATDAARGYRVVAGVTDLKATSGRGFSLLEDRRGNIWVGTLGQGLWRIDAETQAVRYLLSLTGLPSDGIYSLSEDRDGNIWVGTTEGLTRLFPQRTKQLTGVGLVRGVLSSGSGVWVATTEKLLLVDQTVQMPALGTIALNGAIFQAIHRTRNGKIVVATSDGVSTLERGALRPLPNAESLHQIVWIAGDTTDGLWLYDRTGGLNYWRDNTATRPKSKVLQEVRVTAAHTGDDGTVWLGSADGRILRLRAGSHVVTTFDSTSGLPGGPILAIHEDGAARLWVATYGAISRLVDRRFDSVTFRSSLLREISSVVTDERNNVWLGTTGGLVRISTAEIERALQQADHEPRYALLGRLEGMAGLPSLDYSDTGRVAFTKDHRIWFVTGRGVSIVDPAEFETASPPAMPRIYSVIVDGAESLVANQKLELSSRVKKIVINYNAIDLNLPRRKFRYRLDNFDSSWTAGNLDQSAQYTNLRPGHYIFRVQVSNDQESWQDETAVSVNIRPPFYQTARFIIWSAVTGVGVLWLAWAVHVRRLHSSFAMLFAERARMGREIHDTLLQGLVGVALQLDNIAAEDGSASLRTELVNLKGRIEGHVREARQSILNLRSPAWNDTLAQLLRREALTHNGTTPVEFSVAGKPYECAAGVCEEMVMIVREAVINANKHAEATHVLVQLTYATTALRVVVADNGRGFEYESVEAVNGHYGLVGMKERARVVDGTVEIVSVKGAGTSIELIVPTRLMRLRIMMRKVLRLGREDSGAFVPAND